jgi:pyrroloquinoline quinone biosynthesis protein E
MQEPCRSCALRDVDHGGCRCQAFAVTGDPAATDPACGLSPHDGDFRALAMTGTPRPAVVHRSNR